MDINQVIQRLLDQRAELSAPRRQKIIQREVLEHHRELGPSSLITVVTGPRRAGKSVFCAQLLANTAYSYANFDDELLAGIRPEEMNLLVEAWTRIDGQLKTVFLDEVQNIQGWELFVNRLHRSGVPVVLTGSNSRLLSTELASHLTGRHRTIELLPFSFREFLDYRDFAPEDDDRLTTVQLGRMRGWLADYLEQGGFPETYTEPEPRRYLHDLYQSIISRDIAFRHRIRHVAVLRQIAQYLFAHPGTRITHHKLRRIFDLGSVHTIQNYIGFLEESYLLFALDRYARKPKERHRAPRKIVPIDAGMAQVLNRGTDHPVGYLYESAVALELLRRRAWSETLEVRYWQNEAGHEIDFAVSEQSRMTALVQVCFDPADPDTKKRECRALLAGSKELGCGNLQVVTDSFEAEETHDGRRIRFIPLWKWLVDRSPSPDPVRNAGEPPLTTP